MDAVSLSFACIPEISGYQVQLLGSTFDAAVGAGSGAWDKAGYSWCTDIQPTLCQTRPCYACQRHRTKDLVAGRPSFSQTAGLSSLSDQGRVIATNTAIREASSSTSWSWGVAMMEDADIYGWTSAISGCISAGRWETAQQMALGISSASLQAGLITSNAIMGGGRDGEAYSSPWEVCIQHVHPQRDAPWPSFWGVC